MTNLFLFTNDGDSTFNALLLGLKRRFTGSFEIDAEYRLAKATDDARNEFDFGDFPFDNDLEDGPADFEVRGLVGPEIDVLAQRDGDLGQRLRGGFEDVFRLGAAGAIIVGSNLPHLPVDRVISAKRALAERGDRVVLGPTAGGGYYLVGLKSPHPELFSRIDWQTDHVLQQTIARAQSHRLRVRLLPPWYHIGTWPDLACLGEESFEGAPLTRAWLQQSGRLSGQVTRRRVANRLAGEA